jgi:beta-phosphoglucomutase
MKTKKAIIFDLDGVIVDTAKYHYLAWRKIANDLGFDFSKEENEHLKGVSRVQSLDFLLKKGKVKLNQKEKDKLLIAKNEHYLSLISKMDESELLTGIKELLTHLHNDKIPFALGSASKNARRILDTLHLTDLFAAIIDGTNVTKAKPDPEVFVLAARKMCYAPKNCIVIEDSKAGIEAANNVGMTSIGIGDNKVLKDADYILDSTDKLTIDFIKNLL